MGSSQSCLNNTDIKIENVNLLENTQNNVVTTTLEVPKHDKCDHGKTIIIKRPVDFKTIDLSYEYIDEKGDKTVKSFVYQMKEGFGNTSDDSGLSINAIISLVIIALVILYIYRNKTT